MWTLNEPMPNEPMHGYSIFSSSNDMMTSFNTIDWVGGRFAACKGTRLFCKSSSMIDKQMDMAVYLNARGKIPFMHAAMDPHNNLADMHILFPQCATYLLNDGITACFRLSTSFGIERMSAFV